MTGQYPMTLRTGMLLLTAALNPDQRGTNCGSTGLIIDQKFTSEKQCKLKQKFNMR